MSTKGTYVCNNCHAPIAMPYLAWAPGESPQGTGRLCANCAPICEDCKRPYDPLYRCHCETHHCAMQDGLCDECMKEEDENEAKDADNVPPAPELPLVVFADEVKQGWIVITIEGGVVQDVSFPPPDAGLAIRGVQVLDFDVQGDWGIRLHRNSQGDICARYFFDDPHRAARWVGKESHDFYGRGGIPGPNKPEESKPANPTPTAR